MYCPSNFPYGLRASALLLWVETMTVPGATRSGLIRSSSVGPRLLKAASTSESPQIASPATSGKVYGREYFSHFAFSYGPSVRTEQQAPTVKAFFEVAGARNDIGKMRPPLIGSGLSSSTWRPSLPAEKIARKSGC